MNSKDEKSVSKKKEKTVSKNSQQILKHILFDACLLACFVPKVILALSHSVFMVQRDVLNNSSKDKSVEERGYETLKGCNKSFTTFFFSSPFLILHGVQFFPSCFASL
jgi:hypothetical protein